MDAKYIRQKMSEEYSPNAYTEGDFTKGEDSGNVSVSSK